MFELIDRKEHYSGPIFKVFTDKIKMPDDSVIRRDVVEKRHSAAAVLAVKEDGNVVFVRQYRRSADGEILELPAGVVDEGETALACAIRELEEETGLIAGKMEFMFQFYTSVGFCDEVVSIYLASEFSQGVQNFDEGESLVLEEYPVDEAIEMVFDGRIVDSKTVAALLGYQLQRARSH
jgi:ADP-ribose pyrophosphatase